jgi:hypothetical protein
MNWWLAGICFVIVYLCIQMVGIRFTLMQMMKMFEATSQMIGEVTKLDEQQKMKMASTMGGAHQRMAMKYTAACVMLFMVVLFFLFLLNRGHL